MATIKVTKGQKGRYGLISFSECKISTLPKDNVNSMNVDVRLLTVLNYLTVASGQHIHINSMGRAPLYNASIGGEKNSHHLITDQKPVRACDMRFDDRNKIDEFKKFIIQESGRLKSMGVSSFGFYPTFVHLDVKPSALTIWGADSNQFAALKNSKASIMEMWAVMSQIADGLMKTGAKAREAFFFSHGKNIGTYHNEQIF